MKQAAQVFKICGTRLRRHPPEPVFRGRNVWTPPGRGNRGLTLVEVTLCIFIFGLATGIMAYSYVKGIDVASEFEVSTSLIESLNNAAYQVWLDMKDSRTDDLDLLPFTDPGLLGESLAVLINGARDRDYQFHLSETDFSPQWLSVIVYCPYKTSGGVTELRRYVVYPTPADPPEEEGKAKKKAKGDKGKKASNGGHEWPFHFSSGSAITPDQIFLRDSSKPSKTYTIDRHQGNPGDYRPLIIVGTNVLLSSFTEGNNKTPANFVLGAKPSSQRFSWMYFRRKVYVSPRN